ncbi:Hypothetical predicted protein [Marmota monax]|uniref:Uncharacterized protein n=1 Tax=Marmota monax TaxID=9995 RepID=A0A5E4CRG6_MARMO|nr:hypothetical protein GHT09_015949 [Marmota monax]VTJ84387.1 Hypothetical predicted protein [Marmota monax]
MRSARPSSSCGCSCACSRHSVPGPSSPRTRSPATVRPRRRLARSPRSRRPAETAGRRPSERPGSGAGRCLWPRVPSAAGAVPSVKTPSLLRLLVTSARQAQGPRDGAADVFQIVRIRISLRWGHQARSLRRLWLRPRAPACAFHTSSVQTIRGAASLVPAGRWLSGPFAHCSPPTVLNHSPQPDTRWPRWQAEAAWSMPALPAGSGYSLPVISGGLCTGAAGGGPLARRHPPTNVSQTRNLPRDRPSRQQ